MCVSSLVKISYTVLSKCQKQWKYKFRAKQNKTKNHFWLLTDALFIVYAFLTLAGGAQMFPHNNEVSYTFYKRSLGALQPEIFSDVSCPVMSPEKL